MYIYRSIYVYLYIYICISIYIYIQLCVCFRYSRSTRCWNYQNGFGRSTIIQSPPLKPVLDSPLITRPRGFQRIHPNAACKRAGGRCPGLQCNLGGNNKEISGATGSYMGILKISFSNMTLGHGFVALYDGCMGVEFEHRKWVQCSASKANHQLCPEHTYT